MYERVMGLYEGGICPYERVKLLYEEYFAVGKRKLYRGIAVSPIFLPCLRDPKALSLISYMHHEFDVGEASTNGGGRLG